LSSINGSGAVSLRYVSGGAQATVAVNRVASASASQADTMLSDWDGGGQGQIDAFAFHHQPDVWL
jgi:hypothetical protein